MSANHWSRCPRCTKEREAIFANLEQQVADSYGKVPVEQFDQNRENLEKERAILESDAHRTWREDWDVDGAVDGVIKFTYKGGCNVCKLRLEFTHEEPIVGA